MCERIAEEEGMLYVHPVNGLLLPWCSHHTSENVEDLLDVGVIINSIGGGSGAVGGSCGY